MENTSEKKDKNSVKKPLKHICIGLVAHVDAGKTTLSEGMLYLSGQIRNMGRVDHGDTFLDNYETERERGITIFSKQAEFIWNDTSITILDTPGHVDFSAEMERVLQVLDCAVLVVSAVDGVQAHTVTLWRLLKQYKIPTMIFVNKMDRQEADREKLLEELKNRFGDGCVEMDMQSEENRESLAMCDETMLEEYLSGGKIEKETVKKAVAARKVFPCWFGSALKAQGIEALMSGLCEYAPSAEPLPEFGAKVYKIARDPQGNRLTYLKVTGGTLKVKDVIAEERYAALIEELGTLPEKIQKTLDDKERIQWFASKYANAKDAFFIGRGLDYAVALEGSLKFKEISYIHSEAFAAGEMKHGPISLVEKGTLVVGILTQPDLFEKSVSNMVEVKSRGAFLMGLTTYGNYSIEDTAGFTVYVPKTDPHFATSLSVIPLQLLAYYVSCAKGLDVDKPRNLAKSVTVE